MPRPCSTPPRRCEESQAAGIDCCSGECTYNRATMLASPLTEAPQFDASRKINHVTVKSAPVSGPVRARAGVSMLHRSPVRSLPVTVMPQPSGHDGCARSPGSRPSRARPTQVDWTLGHGRPAGAHRPVAFWIIVGSLVVMAGWSAMTATYFAFRDDVLTRLLARQAQMQFAYEDRIADLRGQVDRLASRQLLDQEQFETKLEQITRRQALLESRSSALSSLPDPTPTGSIKPTPRAAAPAMHRAASQHRSPRRSTTPSSCCRRPSVRRGWNPARRSMRACVSPRCRPRPASRARSRGCRPRSIASKPARSRPSTRWKRAMTPRRAACATCSPISGSTSARSRPRRPRAQAAARSFRPAPAAFRHSTASSTASGWRAGMSIG